MEAREVTQTHRFVQEAHFCNLLSWSVDALLSENLRYNDSFQLKSIGSLLIRNRTKEVIEDDRMYKQVTVRLYGKGVVQRGETLVSGKSIGTKNQYRVSEGQFIMSKIDARNGAFGIVPQELDGAITTQDFLSYTINAAEIVSQFFVLIISSEHFYALCQRASSGTTGRQRIDEKAFLNFKIPLPDKAEQQRLVDEYDLKLEAAKNIGQKIEVTRNTRIKFLSDYIGIYPYDHSHEENKEFQLVQFKSLVEWGINSPLTRLRNFYKNLKFSTKPIKLLCSVSSGGTPSRGVKTYYGGDIPWVKTGEVREDIIWDTEEKLTVEGLKNSSAKVYSAGSLIIAMYGATAGRSAKLGIEAATNQACAVLYDIDNSIILTDYLWIYLISQIDNFKLLASGSAQPNLNAAKVANYEVPVPPLENQREIINAVKSFYVETTNLQNTANRLLTQAKFEFEAAIFNID
ncbi:MAG: restriction endonuclease subunit S [Tunicatimonas sp.]